MASGRHALKTECWPKEIGLLVRGMADIRASMPELSFFVVHVQGIREWTFADLLIGIQCCEIMSGNANAGHQTCCDRSKTGGGDHEFDPVSTNERT